MVICIYSVLIADRNEDFCSVLEAAVNADGNCYVVGKAFDGEQAIGLIHELKPDIIVLNPMLKQIDGLFILWQLREYAAGYRPKIYILSEIDSDAYLQALRRLDVDYISLKPVYTDVVVRNLYHIMLGVPDRRDVQKEKRKGAVQGLFSELEIPANLLSARQVEDAILLCLEDETKLTRLSTKLYVIISKRYDTTVNAVERNIRTIIQRMEQAGTERYRHLFQGRSVSNAVFLHTVVHYIRDTMDESRVQL